MMMTMMMVVMMMMMIEWLNAHIHALHICTHALIQTHRHACTHARIAHMHAHTQGDTHTHNKTHTLRIRRCMVRDESWAAVRTRFVLPSTYRILQNIQNSSEPSRITVSHRTAILTNKRRQKDKITIHLIVHVWSILLILASSAIFTRGKQFLTSNVVERLGKNRVSLNDYLLSIW